MTTFEQDPDTGDLRRVRGPLRLIFWGALLCLLDFSFTSTTNGEGFKFDILNDFLGMILISVGIFRLAGLTVTRSYARAMIFLRIVTVLSTVKAFFDHFIFSAPPALNFLQTTYGLFELAAIIVFCLTMRLVCVREGLEGPAASWKTTTILFVIIYALPLGAFYLAAAGAILLGESFNINLGMAGLALIPVFFIPLIHFFISTSRMSRAADEASGSG
jgi:hypothetical protein